MSHGLKLNLTLPSDRQQDRLTAGFQNVLF